MIDQELLLWMIVLLVFTLIGLWKKGSLMVLAGVAWIVASFVVFLPYSYILLILTMGLGMTMMAYGLNEMINGK